MPGLLILTKLLRWPWGLNEVGWSQEQRLGVYSYLSCDLCCARYFTYESKCPHLLSKNRWIPDRVDCERDAQGKGPDLPNWLNSSFRLSSSTSSPKFLIYTLVNSLALAPSSASRSFRDLNLPTNLKRNHKKVITLRNKTWFPGAQKNAG